MRTCCALLLALAACAAPLPARPSRPPNIVLILADDLGVHDLGCYGRAEHRTPRLDALAAQGIRFTSATCAQPICSPSRAAILTGKTPARLHLTTYLPGRKDAPSQKVLHPRIRQELPLEEPTLAERLREAGYATALFGKWHLGGKGFGPETQGFDLVHAGSSFPRDPAGTGGKGELDLADRAARFIAEHRERPFFLFLPHHTPHIPLQSDPGRTARHAAAFHPVYAALMESMDESVGRVLDALDREGLSGDTIVLFTSDNGGLHVPELREDPPTHNGPFRAGKGFLYEGGLRVPLLVRWPGRIAPAVTDLPVVNTDFLPTLLDLAALPVPAGLDGRSLAPLLRGGTMPPRRLFWHFPHYTNQGGRPGGAVRDGTWKLVEFYDGGLPELYDLASDPGETRDLAAAEPAQTAELSRALREWRVAVGAQEPTPNPAADEAAWARLYRETDVSRLRPAATAAAMTPALRDWRRAMDGAAR